jgi:hypothetical protein
LLRQALSMLICNTPDWRSWQLFFRGALPQQKLCLATTVERESALSNFMEFTLKTLD